MSEGRLPLADQSFDIVFSKDALIEAKDKAPLRPEAFRILREHFRLRKPAEIS